MHRFNETEEEDYSYIYQVYVGRCPVLQRPENRRKTDIFFLIVFIVCIALLLPLLIYIICYSDINRLQRYDKCGNICGQNNCTSQDVSTQRVSYGEECLNEQSLSWSSWFFKPSIWKITIESFIPLDLCLILVLLFKNAAAVAVWGIVILSWLIFPIFGIILIFTSNIVVGILFFLVAVLTLCIIIFNRDKIRLVTIHLGEATKAIFDINMLFYVAAGTLLISFTILLIHTVITFHIMATYIPVEHMVVTIILNPVITIWVVQFNFGIRDMIISGAVTKWYCTKDEDKLKDALSTSLRVTLKNHLGTIALGSFLNTIMNVPRILLKCLAQFTAINEMVRCCIRYTDGFFTSNSYIMTATHGTSFVQSGKKVTKLLNLSMGNTISIYSSADFVILLGQNLIIGVTTLITYTVLRTDRFDEGTVICSLLIEIGIAYICTHTVLGLLKIASNTIFFCIIEESLNNKETNYPYTMTMKELSNGSDRVFMNKVRSRSRSSPSKKNVFLTVFLVVLFCCVICALLVAAYII